VYVALCMQHVCVLPCRCVPPANRPNSPHPTCAHIWLSFDPFPYPSSLSSSLDRRHSEIRLRQDLFYTTLNPLKPDRGEGERAVEADRGRASVISPDLLPGPCCWNPCYSPPAEWSSHTEQLNEKQSHR
jgi:hypothetical protein